MKTSHQIYLVMGALALAGCQSPSGRYLKTPRDHSFDIADGKRHGTTVVVSKPNGVSIYNEFEEDGHVAVEGFAKRDSKRNFVYYRTQDGKLINAAFPYVSELPAKEEVVTQPAAPAKKAEEVQDVAPVQETLKEPIAPEQKVEETQNPVQGTTEEPVKEAKKKDDLPMPVVIKKPSLYRTVITTKLTIESSNVRQ